MLENLATHDVFSEYCCLSSTGRIPGRVTVQLYLLHGRRPFPAGSSVLTIRLFHYGQRTCLAGKLRLLVVRKCGDFSDSMGVGVG
jgi:hypothetical protein